MPRLEQKEIRPLDDEQMAALLSAASGGELEYLVTVALFTGLRLSELLGLTWDCVDFDQGMIAVTKQLARAGLQAEGLFISPKSGKGRTITAAPSVLRSLRAHRARRSEMQLRVGPLWDNPWDLVFTNQTQWSIGPPKRNSNGWWPPLVWRMYASHICGQRHPGRG